MRRSKRPLFVSVVAVMLCLMALAEYKHLRSIGDDEVLFDSVFGTSAVQGAYTVTCLISLLCAMVTAVGLWKMRSWAMACYTAYAIVAVAEEALGTLYFGFGWNEVLLRSVIAIILLFTVGVALRCAIRKATQSDAPADG